MIRKKPTRRYNNLLTPRGNYFDIGGPTSSSNYPLGYTSWKDFYEDYNFRSANSDDEVIFKLGLQNYFDMYGRPLYKDPSPDDYIVKERPMRGIEMPLEENNDSEGNNDSGGNDSSEEINNMEIKKPDLKKTLNGMMGAAGAAAGSLISKGISGGLESGTGNFISGLGNIASAIPGFQGAAIAGGLKVVGGITNAFFGSKLNEENIAKVESNIDNMKSFTSNASSYDALAQNWASAPAAMAFNKRFIGKDGIFTNKASNKFKDLQAQSTNAKQWVNNTLINNANNLGISQLQNLTATYAANGGRIMRGRPKAFGGNLMTHGATFDTGLMSIENGGTHEQNPNEGVPMGVDNEGVPNLVEEGETIFNDYVFSKRLKVPKAVRRKYKLGGTLSFADASKKMAKESEERPNDPISQMGLQDSMFKLMAEQEKIRMSKESKNNINNKFKGGGFTDENGNDLIGLGVLDERRRGEYLAPGLEGTPMWFDTQGLYTNYPNQYTARAGQNGYPSSLQYLSLPSREITDDPERPLNWDGTIKGQSPTNPALEWAAPYIYGFNNAYAPIENNVTQGIVVNGASSNPEIIRPDEENPISKRSVVRKVTPDLNERAAKAQKTFFNENRNSIFDSAPTWMRYVPAWASGIVSLTDLLGWTNNPNYRDAESIFNAARNAGTYIPVSYRPIGNYLTYRPLDRDYFLTQLNAQSGATRRLLTNTSALSRGAMTASAIAADYNSNNSIGDAIMKQELANREQEQRVAEFNRATDMANSEGFLKADMANQSTLMNARNAYFNGILAAAQMRQAERQAASQARSVNFSNFINSIGDIGRENFQRNMIVSDPSKYYTIDSSGNVHYKGDYYKLDEAAQKYIDNDILANPKYKDNNSKSKKRARRGYLTIKRNNR